MTEKEKIIAKLLDERKITSEQAILLLRINNDEKPIEYIKDQSIYLDDKQTTICQPCNDKLSRGEVAVCGCTLYTPKIT